MIVEIFTRRNDVPILTRVIDLNPPRDTRIVSEVHVMIERKFDRVAASEALRTMNDRCIYERIKRHNRNGGRKPRRRNRESIRFTTS